MRIFGYIFTYPCYYFSDTVYGNPLAEGIAFTGKKCYLYTNTLIHCFVSDPDSSTKYISKSTTVYPKNLINCSITSKASKVDDITITFNSSMSNQVSDVVTLRDCNIAVTNGNTITFDTSTGSNTGDNRYLFVFDNCNITIKSNTTSPLSTLKLANSLLRNCTITMGQYSALVVDNCSLTDCVFRGETSTTSDDMPTQGGRLYVYGESILNNCASVPSLQSRSASNVYGHPYMLLFLFDGCKLLGCSFCYSLAWLQMNSDVSSLSDLKGVQIISCYLYAVRSNPTDSNQFFAVDFIKCNFYSSVNITGLNSSTTLISVNLDDCEAAGLRASGTGTNIFAKDLRVPSASYVTVSGATLNNTSFVSYSAD